MHSSSHISTAHLHEDLEISPTCETSDQHLECSNDSNSKTDKATKLHVESKYCQVNMRGDELMRRTIGTQTGVAFTECGTQTEETCLNITEPDEVHDSDDDDDDIDLNSSQETSYPTDSTQFLSPQKKRLKSLLSECSDTETEGHTGSSSEVETDLPSTIKSPQDDLVFLVFEQQLFELFKKCPECGAPVVHKDLLKGHCYVFILNVSMATSSHGTVNPCLAVWQLEISCLHLQLFSVELRTLKLLVWLKS